VLFKYVPFFSLFRNIFFLIPFIMCSYIILMLEVWRSYWLYGPRKNFIWAAFSLIFLAIYMLGFCHPHTTLMSTYVVSAAVALLLVARFSGFISGESRFGIMALLFLCVLQPLEVLGRHADKFARMEPSGILTQAVGFPLAPPVFSYVRPPPAQEGLNPNELYRRYNWHIIGMIDSAGFVTYTYGYPTPWSLELAKASERIPRFQDYVQHKFMVYDSPDQAPPFKSAVDFAQWFSVAPRGKPIGPQDNVSIVRFNANQLFLTTNFDRPKFLVYNDSYNRHWKVAINGHASELRRANFAFKGVQVPAGPSRVDFEFRPPGSGIYPLVLAFFYVYFGYCLWWQLKRKKV
jgi:hypothetical protein